MIALALLVILAQPAHGRRAVRQDVTFAEGITRSRFDLSGTPDTRPDAPLFSFAVPPPGYKGYGSSYAGLPATDGCYAAASVTGTKGEALTFTRATTRFCPTSANEATGVMCASGEVCITSSGTTRGISVFRAGTNLALRSQEFDNAGAWALLSSATRAANAYAAPDGTLTADQVVDASGAAQRGIYQSVTTASETKHTFSVWARCDTGTCEAQLQLEGTGNSAGNQTCTFTGLTTAWTRLACTSGAAYGAGVSAVTAYVLIGDAAGDQYTLGVWGAQYEVSAPYVTPYVATTSASATRNIEVATFANVLPTASFADKYSAAVSWLTPPALIGVVTQTPLLAYGTNGMFEMQQNGTTHRVYHYPSSANVNDGTVSTSTLSRLSGYADGTNKAACLDGVCSTAAGSGSFAGGPWTVYAGTELGGAGTGADGLLSNVCIDPSSTRCR